MSGALTVSATRRAGRAACLVPKVRRFTLVLSSAFTFVAVAVSCADPVHDDAVSALGKEAPDVPAGPLHRPGQPCMTCHGGQGPANTELSFAGTVFTAPTNADPLPFATVHLAGSDQSSIDATTNCAGNFFVRTEDFRAVFPAIVAIEASPEPIVMRTLMHRSGSCNDCHTGATGPTSPGLVWATLSRSGATSCPTK